MSWKVIKSSPDYVIHKSGLIRNKKTLGSISTWRDNSTGYIRIALGLSRKNQKMYYVHRLLAETFLPNPNDLPVVNHKNGIKDDNRLVNLEWCTHEHNLNHAIELGLKVSLKGSQKAGAILHERDIPVIRKLLNQGVSQAELGKKFGVHRSTIQNIVKRFAWTHVL